MYLEHINLTVSNIDEALTFYRVAFPDWVIRGESEQVWFGKPRRWLHFGNEHYYIVSVSYTHLTLPTIYSV